ncbi:hypothetical protein J6590_021118 [Homalodisca vitripennis]|nr:hypothetical protein J6590_021118 [Homalodisca vitripennis]
MWFRSPVLGLSPNGFWFTEVAADAFFHTRPLPPPGDLSETSPQWQEESLDGAVWVIMAEEPHAIGHR